MLLIERVGGRRRKRGEGNVYTTSFCFICARECELLSIGHWQFSEHKGKGIPLRLLLVSLPVTQVMQGEQCKQVSEAPSLLLLSYPWRAFYLVDNEVLHWNRICTTLPFKFILKYLFVLCGVYCLKALWSSAPLGCIKETKYTVRNEDVLGGAQINRITCGMGI